MGGRLPPVIRLDPLVEPIPLVCDSPHSGTLYPADFGHAVPMAALRQGEDTHVHELWSAAPSVGATLLHATFPRAYIDPNRHLGDLDPALIDGAWPDPLDPGEKTRLGKGLVWSRLDADTPIYNRRLSPQEIRRRIDGYYRPYHQALDDAVRQCHARFGCMWHLNLHSMPGDVFRRLGIHSHEPLADFVLGDRDGTTCEPAFVGLVEQYLRGCGYSVARNFPYKGVELIAQIGRPAQRRYSLQVEIRRPVYMDEATREPNAGFAPLRQALSGLLGELSAYVQSQAGTPAHRN